MALELGGGVGSWASGSLGFQGVERAREEPFWARGWE